MKTKTLLAVVVIVLGLVSTAAAHEVRYLAILDGPSESPANDSKGVGTALVTFDLDLVTMRVQSTFLQLEGTTTAAHIHAPTPEPDAKTAGVATETPSFPGFPLGVKAGVMDQTYDMTVAKSYNPAFITASGGTVSDALNALLAALEQNKAYFNIHTSDTPSGEIRGFLHFVPEPGTFTLSVLGGLGLLVVARKRAGAVLARAAKNRR